MNLNRKAPGARTSVISSQVIDNSAQARTLLTLAIGYRLLAADKPKISPQRHREHRVKTDRYFGSFNGVDRIRRAISSVKITPVERLNPSDTILMPPSFVSSVPLWWKNLNLCVA